MSLVGKLHETVLKYATEEQKKELQELRAKYPEHMIETHIRGELTKFNKDPDLIYEYFVCQYKIRPSKFDERRIKIILNSFT